MQALNKKNKIRAKQNGERCMDSRTKLEQLSEVQKMYSAARSEQVKERSENIKDSSDHVNELYLNIIFVLNKISESIPNESVESRDVNSKLIHALINHFLGCCYHHLDQIQQALLFLKKATECFKTLTIDVALDATYLSFYAENCLLQGISEKSLGSVEDLKYYKDAENSLVYAVKLWSKLHKIQQTGAISRLMIAQLSLGEVRTWKGHSAEEARDALTVLQEARALLEDDVSAVAFKKREIDLMTVAHYQSINFLRLKKYSEATERLNDLLISAEKRGDKNFQANAKLGLALCQGMESGFSDEKVKAELAKIYQFYMWTAENIPLRSVYVGITMTWLQGLDLPPEKDRPLQLQWLIALAECKEQPVNTILAEANKALFAL